MSDSIRVFQAITQAQQHQPIAIFDLDSTIYNVSHRTQAILKSFIEHDIYRQKYPAEMRALKQVEVLTADWGLKESLERTQLVSTESFYKDIRDYWKKHFFSSEYLKYDVPYAGAIEYVQRLYQNKTKIMYLTARDEQNMHAGTIESLIKHKLPLSDDYNELIMKPIKGQVEDADFKEVKIKTLSQLSKHIWFFENEPLIIKKIQQTSPQINIVWLNTTHSRRADPPTGLPTIDGHWHLP